MKFKEFYEKQVTEANRSPEELDQREKLIERIESYFIDVTTIPWSQVSTEDLTSMYTALVDDRMIKPMKLK